MRAEAAFLRAALPEPCILLHRRLLPYSLGHEMILRRLGSPFLVKSDDAAELEAKLFSAVFICSKTHDEASVALSDPGISDHFAKWRKTCGRFDISEIVSSFLAYISDGSKGPENLKPANGKRRVGMSRKPGAPFLIIVWQTLMQLGYTRSESLDCPFGLAMWHYVSHHEAKGNTEIMNDSYDAARKAMKERGWEPIRIQR